MNYKKLAIWFGIPLVMIVVWVLAVYLPIDAGAKKKQNMINSILKERKDMEMSIMSMSQQIQTQAGLKKSYNDFLNQTPTIDKMPGFMGCSGTRCQIEGHGCRTPQRALQFDGYGPQRHCQPRFRNGP